MNLFVFLTIILQDKTAEEVIELKKGTRVQWSMVASEGISFPFDGVPFICVGAANYQCHQGDDIDKKAKIRRQQQQKEKEVDYLL